MHTANRKTEITSCCDSQATYFMNDDDSATLICKSCYEEIEWSK